MKNLELKKMSLANIENRLTPEEMENVMAGSCSAGMQVLFAGFVGSMLGPVGAFACAATVQYLTDRNGGRCI